MTAAVDEGWIPSDDTFAARLALVRQRMGWNQKEAALACGFPAASWRNWENDGRRPHDLVSTCEAIHARTGARVDWLIKGSRTGQEPPGGAMNRGYAGGTQAFTADNLALTA